ncbi:hypothetical protein [Caldiplasma sukawensis]
MAVSSKVKCEVCGEEFPIKTSQYPGEPGIILHFRTSHSLIYKEIYEKTLSDEEREIFSMGGKQ